MQRFIKTNYALFFGLKLNWYITLTDNLNIKVVLPILLRNLVNSNTVSMIKWFFLLQRFF